MCINAISVVVLGSRTAAAYIKNLNVMRGAETGIVQSLAKDMHECTYLIPVYPLILMKGQH